MLKSTLIKRWQTTDKALVNRWPFCRCLVNYYLPPVSVKKTFLQRRGPLWELARKAQNQRPGEEFPLLRCRAGARAKGVFLFTDAGLATMQKNMYDIVKQAVIHKLSSIDILSHASRAILTEDEMLQIMIQATAERLHHLGGTTCLTPLV